MNIHTYRNKLCTCVAAAVLMLHTGCKKLVTIDPPISSITTAQVFKTDIQAKAAMAGVYTLMINGTSLISNNVYASFAAGLTTYIAAQSADEIVPFGTINIYASNKLTVTGAYYGSVFWNTAYKIIYGTNAVIEGIEASTSGNLHDDVRAELTGEAKFVRAFCYAYLIRMYGDVPLALTVDFNQTATLPRTPKEQVYAQILKDLQDAQGVLATDYSAGNGERIVPNKWAATALLARVYLDMGDYPSAVAQADMVISNTGQYSLAAEPNDVFLKNSKEAIWQLQQNSNIQSLGTATPEGAQFIPYPNPHTGNPYQYLATELLHSFEPGDKRRMQWVDSTDNSVYGVGGGWFYYPFKYKTGGSNRVVGGSPSEYYMVLRLAEQYLIRAEAAAKGAGKGPAGAVADLDSLRHRAGLGDVDHSLTGDQLWTAVAHERQTELFCEWGHRWYDLIRMKLAHDVLSNIPAKQPWAGDYQLLYPLPANEIIANHYLTQNPGYNN